MIKKYFGIQTRLLNYIKNSHDIQSRLLGFFKEYNKIRQYSTKIFYNFKKRPLVLKNIQILMNCFFMRDFNEFYVTVQHDVYKYHTHQTISPKPWTFCETFLSLITNHSFFHSPITHHPFPLRITKIIFLKVVEIWFWFVAL